MKKSYLLIAVAMIAALSMTGCKNNKKSQNQEPTQEEIQAQKQALADSVLAQVDVFIKEFAEASSESFEFKTFKLTDAEKMVKPDYLLDLAVAGTLVTRSQKINALAIYGTDCIIKFIYGMPMDETKEVMARLAADVSHPVDVEVMLSNLPVSEKIRKRYEACKEQDDIAQFWQFYNAVLVESAYIISNNPELFFSKITEEQWQSYHNRRKSWDKAVETLAQYDDELASILQWRNENLVLKSEEEGEDLNSSVLSDKKFYIENKDKFAARRNALLQ